MGLGRIVTMAALVLSPAAAAQDYPAKSIRLIVPFPAGGPSDSIARVVADKIASLLGQPMVIENRGGAGGVTGTALVAKAEPDGYTIGLGSAGSLAISLSLQDKIPYDPLKDLKLLTLVAISPEVLVIGRGVEAASTAELIGIAKAKPGKLNFASTGKGSMSHLSSELFRLSTGIDIVHVPYSGASPAVNDLLGGHVQMLFADIQVLLGSVQSGQLRALAMGGKRRAVALPHVPTTTELGLPQVEASNWYGAVLPPATPAAIVGKLHAAFVAAIRSDEVKAKLIPQGCDLIGDTPEQFQAFVTAEIAKWGRVVRDAGVKGN